MQIVKKSEAEYYTGNGYYGYDYPTVDPDINFAVISISTRSPEVGYQVNRGCKELLYIIKGSGNLYKKDSPMVKSDYPFFVLLKILNRNKIGMLNKNMIDIGLFNFSMKKSKNFLLC